MDKALTTDFDYFAKSLYVEAELFLGDEFCKLPLRVRTGYIKAFYYNQTISRGNRHVNSYDSFTMNKKDTKRYFGDPQVFCDVNANGYWLRSKNGKYGPIDGKYVICKKNHEDGNECQPTKWFIKTKWAYQTSKNHGVSGSTNGYKLSPKITELMSIWQAKLANGEYKDTETALIDGKLNNIYDNEELKKGAIVRDKTAIDESINVNLMVDINIVSLNMYKELLTRLEEYFDANKIEGIVRGSKRWKEVEKEVKGRPLETEEEGRREAQGGSTETQGTPKRHFHDHVAVKHLFDKDIEKQQVRDQLGEVNKILNYTRELNAPIMPVIYEEKSTGRYFAMHADLQGYRRSVRYSALEGCYEYDIEAAHQNILLEVFHRKEIDFKELDVIRDYIQNKSSIRDKLAKDLDIHKSLVKRVITGLTYGAKLVNNKKTSLYKDCNGDHKVINRVIANEWLKSLATVFKETSFHLVNDKDDITNAVGINRPIKSKGKVEGINKSQAVAHILQGHEREVVDAVISHYDRNDIVLLLHDCVVFKDKVSSHEMSRIVAVETGFNLSFEEGAY
jgi:hypothetical protein